MASSSFHPRLTVLHRLLQTPRLNQLYSLRFTAKNNHEFPINGFHAKYCMFWVRGAIFPNHCEGTMVVGHDVQKIRRYTSSESPDKQPGGEITILQRFKKILYNFYLGAKVLYGDVKTTLKIRRKLKANNRNYNVLSRKEQWTMFKTQKNLKKTFPILIVSFLPVVGYIGPILGFLRPREFLSPHFWTMKQRRQYRILDNKERSEYLNIVLKDISNQTKELSKEEHHHGLIRSFADKNDIDPRNDILIRILPIFSSGVLKLENLQHGHLKNLCSFWLLSSWLPSSFLQKMLRREMVEIHKDDAAISRDGLDALSDQELEEACHVRGLNTSNVSSENQVRWLQDWIDLSKQVSETETTFLAHVAVFKTVNIKP